MKLKIRYFSVLKDATGKDVEMMDVDRGITVSKLYERLSIMYPSLRAMDEFLILVNGRPASKSYKLDEGDEVAIIPPVSGGSVIKDEIDLNKEVKRLVEESGPESGAIVIFLGFVKGSVKGSKVNVLEYEAYEPFASRKIEEIEKDAEVGNVKKVRIYHRTGSLKPGEPTLYIFVSAISRKEAFETARRVLERVKHEVPIFKLERREDGEYWVIGDGKRVKRAKS